MRSTGSDWIVIDDFFPDPASVRAQALAATFSVFGVAPVLREIFETTPETIEHLKKASGVPEIAALTSRFHWYPAKNGDRTSVIHYDPCQWSALVYLSQGRDGETGTRFFRHRETGIEHLPSPVDLSFLALERGISPSELIQNLRRDQSQVTAWEPVAEIAFRFNRFVMFPGPRFHAAGNSWGETPEDSRLTVNFFFDAVKKEKGEWCNLALPGK